MFRWKCVIPVVVVAACNYTVAWINCSVKVGITKVAIESGQGVQQVIIDGYRQAGELIKKRLTQFP